MENIITLPGWSAWSGSVIPCKRKVLEELGGGRQLVGYLAELPSAGWSVLTLRVDEHGEHMVTIRTFESMGILTDSVREAWAEVCYREFSASVEAEAHKFAIEEVAA